MKEKTEIPATTFFLQNPGPKGTRYVDIEAERNKPALMSIDEFAEKLMKYSVSDFLDTYEPYYDLMEASQWRIGLYSQYSAVLVDVVRKKTDNQRIISRVIGRVESEQMTLYSDFTNNIILYIHSLASSNTDKVSVLPLICGSGKSTALTYVVINTIMRVQAAQGDTKANKVYKPDFLPDVTEDQFNGLLIVTDSKERLRKIWDPDPNNRNIDPDIRRIIDEHKECVSIITEENSKEEERKQRYAPVLLMTTQRYFGWEKEEILRHLEWEDENGVHKRPLIIFDEQPYLNEIRDVTVDMINNIDTALRTCLDDKVDRDMKQWCCDQWDLFRDRFLAYLEQYEYGFEGLDTLYCEPTGNTITENDPEFFSFIETYRSKLRTRTKDYYSDILTVRQFMNSWSVFNHRGIDSGEYSNKFSVFIDNRDKLTNLGAKVIVLDGTGDISPIYAGQDYIDIRDGSNYLRSLSYLTIKLADFDTSKEEFRKVDISKPVLAYLKNQGYEKKDLVFFTYKGKDSKFQATVNGKKIKNVAHFGDIRGKNDFTSESAFAQVGLNRMQPVHYLVHVLARNDDMREDLAKRDPESMFEQIHAIYQDDRYKKFMTDHVLADTDQCMFRSAIRNADNLQPVTYYIFYKYSQYPRLKAAIEKRYKKKLGAHIDPIKKEDVWDAVGAGTIAWQIRNWLDKWDGKPIKQKDLLARLNINRDSFNSAKRRDQELSSLLKQYNLNAKRMRYKGAWYAKTCSK